MFNLFLPRFHRKNEFTDFCENILEEAEKKNEKTFNNSNMNFINILLANKNHWTSREIQDEVSTMILSVSNEPSVIHHCEVKIYFREMRQPLSQCLQFF